MSPPPDLGLLCCSLKSDNLLLAAPLEEGSDLPAGLVKVADLGMCARLDPCTGRVTEAMRARGTRPFMAPELYAEEPTASTATDVYALGGVAFELAHNQQPFREIPEDSVLELAQQVWLVRLVLPACPAGAAAARSLQPVHGHARPN